MSITEQQHLTVVGAGIVGLSCARSAQRRGWKVTIVDRDFEGDRASHGNAGGIAVSECLPLSLSGMGLKPLKWLLDPLGPLSIRPVHAWRLLPWYLALRAASRAQNYNAIGGALAQLNNRALADFELMLADLGLSSALHKRGALTVYESADTFAADEPGWRFKRDHGVRWRSIEPDELRTLEPGLASVFERAVMLEDWAHVSDPTSIVGALRQTVQRDGAELVEGDAVGLITQDRARAGVKLRGGTTRFSDYVLVAAGAWSALLAETIGDRALLESERGYNTTLPRSADRLNREVIFAEKMFVATPLAIGLRIGGAAEFAGLTAPPNYKRSQALLALARRYIPDLNEAGAEQWMGQRPTTPDSLPVIGASPRCEKLLYAFGHGHLGVTQSATTARLVADLLEGKPSSLDLAPYSIERFNRGIHGNDRAPLG
jgi:D-amino-acid dehydrogenase